VATISSPGVGSGLDVKTIVSQLMLTEQKPMTDINTKESSINSQISAYGQLSSLLSTLKTAASALNTPSSVSVFNATFSDTTFGSATANSTADAGNYDIQVTNLAKANTLASKGFALSSTTVGDGTLSITSGSNNFSVTVDSSNYTVAGIRDAINKATGNTSVTASIINDTAGSHLVLTGKNTGSANGITVAATEGATAGLKDLAYPKVGAQGLTQGNAAQDATLTLNGIPIVSASNTMTDAISGVTFSLTKANSSATLTVTRNSAATAKLATDFAAAYSQLSSTVKTLTAYNQTAKKGSVLTGDGTTSMVMSQIRGAMNTVPAGLTGTYTTLAQVGISIQADGSMSVDSTKLQSAMDSNFSAVQTVLGAYGKVISDLGTSLTDTKGVVTSRVSGLNSRIKSLEDQKIIVQARLDRIQARYLAQFTNLDTVIGQLTATSSFLTQQLTQLPKISS